MAGGRAGAEGIVDPGGKPPGIAAAPLLMGGGMLICPAAPATSYDQLKVMLVQNRSRRCNQSFRMQCAAGESCSTVQK